MHTLTQEMLLELMREREGPCLSLYQRTHRHFPDNAQDPIRFGNLVKQLEQSLRQQPEDARSALLRPFHRLHQDAEFWKHTLDGLVVLGAAGESHVLRLARPVPDFAVAAQSWHVKPLFRIHQSADSFQVLCLTREWIRLYEGNRDALDEVDLVPGVPRTISDALGDELTEPYQKVSSYGLGPAGGGADMRHGHGSKKDELDKDIERFFRAIDGAVLEHYSKPSRLPLMLVALPQYQGIFRKLTHNPYLLAEGIALDPGALDAEQLKQQAWVALEPAYLRRTEALSQDFHAGRAKGLGSADLDDTLQAAVAGRVGTLLVAAERHIAGRLDVAAMKVVREDDFVDPATGDVLDDLVELVVRHGGKAVVVPEARMPTQTGIAATYRY